MNLMARKQNIKFLMKQELNKMQAFGKSKYQDQLILYIF